MSSIKNIVIVGGGTAGWLVANHLGKKFADTSIKVTVVESPNIPTVGVGEGTVPQMRDTLAYFGISETKFLRECQATFKQSIRFNDWVYGPHSNKEDFYHHVFDPPFSEAADPVAYWLKKGKVEPFVDCVSVQGRLCEQGFAPKLITTPEYEGVVNYAYHLDAARFSELLTQNAVESFGVCHRLAEINQVCLDSHGYISSLNVVGAEKISADFFVDCTGFSSLLLGEALGAKFLDKQSVLFADNALAVQVPYDSELEAIPPYTIAHAQNSGWIWDIGLTERRGVGHVYSSAFISHDQAEVDLRRYLNDEKGDFPVRRIPMRVGYRDKFWLKNCVAIGLSAGFVEPLEATGLLVFDSSSRLLAEMFPVDFEHMALVSCRYNEITRYSWERVIDFVKMHYLLSRRKDSEFWLANTDWGSAPDTLKERLSVWYKKVPTSYDFFSRYEVFNYDNYLYVLYGMGFATNISLTEEWYKEVELAARSVKKINVASEQMISQLPTHKKLLELVKLHGFQRC